jgi:cytoskeletal protein CcmA (bactofilin family)
MFRRREPRGDDAAGDTNDEPFTYLHAGTVVRGALEASGRVRVHGSVLGDVRVDGVLEVAEGGVIEGSLVEAEEVRVLGSILADVTARTRMEIWKDGRVEGDIQATVLDIEEGATFIGRSLMGAATRPGLPASDEGGAESARPGDADEVAPEGFGADDGAAEPSAPTLPTRE